MKRSNFRPTGVNSSRRNTLKIQRFAGVDYTSQKLEIQNGRAIDLLNYIFKDDVIQKRNGYEELYQLSSLEYAKKDFDGKNANVVSKNGTRINSVFSFKAEDNKEHIIAHIGKLLYEIKISDKISFEPLVFEKTNIGRKDYFTCYEYEDFKSQAFISENKLWFLGGNKFVCIRFFVDGLDTKYTVTPVEQMAYAPTTTINITKTGSKVSGRAELDRVNLMSQFRVNKLLTGTPKEEALADSTVYNEYVLSSPLIVKPNEQNKSMADFHIVLEERGKIE